MKKNYIAPNTVAFELIQSGALCGSPNAGTNQQQNPTIDPLEDPNA